MNEPFTLIIIFVTFVLAGFVKGVIGLGLPSITLALLTATIGLTDAMALLLVPSLVTNVWQAVRGGQLVTLTQRLWSFFCLATAMVWIGSYALLTIHIRYLSALLGVLLTCYALTSLLGRPIKLAPTQERWAAPVFGAINGVLTGMTGSFVVPGVMYLQAIGLSRDALVQAMGILFTVSTFALAIVLQQRQLLTQELALLSFAGLVPAVGGMWLGQRMRTRLSESSFRRVFFIALVVLGLYICIRATGVAAG